MSSPSPSPSRLLGPSHNGSLCERCGSCKYDYKTKGLAKNQIQAFAWFLTVAPILSSLVIGVIPAAALCALILGAGYALASRANPQTITVCSECKAVGTMRSLGSPEGRALLKKHYPHIHGS